jgi:hypothetical protein
LADRPDIGPLLRIAGALDALLELVKGLSSPLPAEESVPLFTRTRVIGVYVYKMLDEERAYMLQQFVGKEFLDPEKKDLPSFSARASLGVLCGYVHGCITELELEAQRDANAREYAEAKVREERGAGFRPSNK